MEDLKKIGVQEWTLLVQNSEKLRDIVAKIQYVAPTNIAHTIEYMYTAGLIFNRSTTTIKDKHSSTFDIEKVK